MDSVGEYVLVGGFAEVSQGVSKSSTMEKSDREKQRAKLWASPTKVRVNAGAVQEKSG